MNVYQVRKLATREFTVSVPASKSILSRALLLAAFIEGETLLSGCEEFGQDGDDMLRCLHALGVRVDVRADGLLVHGTREFSRHAALDVGSAGTAARFLPAMLAYLGGEYEFRASPQMQKRPMELLAVLQEAGVKIQFLGEEGRFPFRLKSEGIAKDALSVNTDTSTQYASGLLLAAAAGDRPFTLRLTGKRTEGSYIRTTLHVLSAFGARTQRTENDVSVFPARSNTARFAVPPDFSGACYFYALSLLCGAKVRVRGTHADCDQADFRLMKLLQDRGVVLTDGEEGLLADGSGACGYAGFDEDLRDFSDQTLTLAALAPFANSPTLLRNVGHIRRQECDRVEAILSNLRALGVPCECRGEDIAISPAPVRPAEIETFGDHRVAMAFALVGLKAGGVTIRDPACCKKTFKNYFEILNGLTRQ